MKFGPHPVRASLSPLLQQHWPFPAGIPLRRLPVFSTSYNFLFPQLLSFHIHANCPRRVGGISNQRSLPDYKLYVCLSIPTVEAAKSLRIRTSAECARNSFRIRTYKSKGLKVLCNPHLQKTRGEGGKLLTRSLIPARSLRECASATSAITLRGESPCA
jgi:hypothetical protein